MAQATFHFPRGFLWGTATASHQVEGNNTNNNWWAWEQQPGHIWQDHKSGLACDWWGGRWREDFDRAAETGQNAHRLSVEWSRIQPTPDRWDEEALDRYVSMVRGLLERDIMPFVTLHHFSDPLWLVEQGGWENEAVVGKFEAFVRRVVETLKDYVSYWFTINEPNVYTTEMYLLGHFPHTHQGLGNMFQVATNQVRAHAAAYHAIHSLQPTARVGIATQYRSFVPSTAFEKPVAGIAHHIFNNLVPRALYDGVVRLPWARRRIPQAKGTQDFLGLNYYTRNYVSLNPFHKKDQLFGLTFRPDAELSPTGFLANEPEGMFEAIKWGLQFKIPIIISENGVEDAEDRLRPSYLAQHLHQVWRAVDFNFPVKGYFHWTLVDNFEWERGWVQRYGLWELDPDTQARRKRPSADFYAEICRANALSAEMVARYAPGVFHKLFPN